MAAYAALVSLSKVIDLTLSHEHKYVHVCSIEQMMSLHEDIARLQDLLEHLSGRSHPSIDVLESRIRDVAYKMEDIIEHASMEYDIPNHEDYIPCIESDIPSHEDNIPSIESDIPSKISFFRNFTSLFCMRSSPVAETPSSVTEIPSPVPETAFAFDICAREVSMLLKEAMEMKEDKLKDKDTSGPRPPLTSTISSSEAPTGKMDINEVPVDIMDWIFGRGSKLEIVPITGMGGIGKTTLARAVYQHPNTQRHFDICSWVTISQQYSVKEILRGLLPSDQQSTPDERLIEFVHKRLIGRRYLIVLDDMWDENAWDRIRNAFPDDKKGSRIILTTRLLDVAGYVGSSSHVHKMQFLNDEQSWDLLRKEVSGYTLWHRELEDLGRKISRNCRGLPLAIVAMAGILKFNMTEEYWKRVARDTKSETAANYDDHLLDILALSYTNLPPYLKPCFLYLGSYREDYRIPTRELVRLWTAEGLIKPKGSKEMEEVAEEYLEELVARSLVLVKKKRRDGRIKTCGLHDVLRDLSISKAQQENFFQVITRSSSWMDRYSSNGLRRVNVDSNYFTKELVHHTHIRSLRCDMYGEEVLSVIQHFRLIRVLGNVHITENSRFSILYELTNLRYLHVHLWEQRLTVGESISKLQNLETVIFSLPPGACGCIFLLASGTWEMPRLRHLILAKGILFQCQDTLSEISCSGLQTLAEVTNFDLTRSMTANFSDLKKLKLNYDYFILEDESREFRFNYLVHLSQLEELTIASDGLMEVIDLSFPNKLKKLSLLRTKMSVDNMSLIGSLPNLEVLKLGEDAFKGNEWEPIEGEFVQLRYLQMEWVDLEEWRAEGEHFPQLETLIIKYCVNLKEVPAEIGEINTLKKLVLDNCKAAEESVQEIKAEQESLCNDFLQVIIIRRPW